jgi:outer membrane immunogenic protein
LTSNPLVFELLQSNNKATKTGSWISDIRGANNCLHVGFVLLKPEQDLGLLFGGVLMKRITIALLTGAALALSVSQGASAAELAVKAAPPPPPAPSWTGLYIGVHAGAAWQSAPQWSFFDPNAAAGLNVLTANTNVGGTPALGGVGGIQAGYNWQFAPAWVVGIEGDISWASLADHRGSPIFFGPASATPGFPVVTGGVQMSANTEWLSSVRGKFGFTGWLNNTMLYATGGVAWANIEYAANGFTGPPATALTQSNTSFDTTRSGWVVGGGAEWMATTNILLRAEYLFYNINNGNVAASAGFFPPIGGLTLPFTYNFASYNVQVFRVAGSYKF